MVGLSALTSALSATQQSGEWRCRCPAHNDTNPSLWIREIEGKILLHCFAGCSQDSVINALKDRGLWEKSNVCVQRKTPAGIPYFWPPAAVLKKNGIVPSSDSQKVYVRHYVYKINGEIRGHVARYEGHGKKDVIPFFRRREDGSWQSGHAKEFDRPLFNTEILDKSPSTIYIVEGESCALSIDSAITWPGGAAAWKKADWSPVIEYAREHSVQIVLWPDKDAAGLRAMTKIFEMLKAALPATGILFVDPKQFSASYDSGYDCADWKAQGNNDLSSLQLFDRLEAPKEEILPLTVLSLTDLGNAERFVRMWKDTARYVPTIGWHFWNGVTWIRDSENECLMRAGETARNIKAEAEGLDEKKAKAVLKYSETSQNLPRLKAMCTIASGDKRLINDINDFDANPYDLCVQNGVYDLESGKLRKFDVKDLITQQAACKFDPKAECPTWERFISDIMCGKPNLVNFLRRAVGYSITGDTSEQVMFFAHGKGSNGKSVLLETLGKLLGKGYASSTPVELFLLNTRGEAAVGSNAIARLRGARFVNGSEVPTGARLNESRIKEMTGEDTLAARFLYQEFHEFVPKCKFWLRANNRPEIVGNDYGIWRRLVCIPFLASFTEKDKDPKLKEKLYAEFPGILNWAIRGFYEYKAEGLNEPKEVIEQGDDYREDMDLLGGWLAERCVVDPESIISSSLLYASYRDWCVSAGEKVFPMRKLSNKLKDRGYDRIRRNDGRYYKGIRLRPEVEIKMHSGTVDPRFNFPDDDGGGEF